MNVHTLTSFKDCLASLFNKDKTPKRNTEEAGILWQLIYLCVKRRIFLA